MSTLVLVPLVLGAAYAVGGLFEADPNPDPHPDPDPDPHPGDGQAPLPDPDRIIGTAGDDVLVWEKDGDFVLDGRAGDDQLSNTGSGDGEMRGGAGDDTLVNQGGETVMNGGPGADVLQAGSAADWLSYANAGLSPEPGIQLGVTVDLEAGTAARGDAEGDTITGFKNVIGTAGVSVHDAPLDWDDHASDDHIFGDEDDNILRGGYVWGSEDSDTIDGRGGDDRSMATNMTGSRAVTGPTRLSCGRRKTPPMAPSFTITSGPKAG